MAALPQEEETHGGHDHEMGKTADPQEKLGPYILGRRLGKGAYGLVRLAKHENPQIRAESVAIKLLQIDELTGERSKMVVSQREESHKSVYSYTFSYHTWSAVWCESCCCYYYYCFCLILVPCLLPVSLRAE